MTRMNSTKVKNEGKIEMRKQKGFSLIELLIVVAIILIIAAIAIPNLMRARMSANDSSAAASERTIVTGEISYFAAYPTVGYTSLAALGGASPCVPRRQQLASSTTTWPRTVRLGSGKSGYTFALATSTAAGSAVPNQFYTTAGPLSGGSTGTKAFCAFDDGVVRQSAAGTWVIPGSYAACQALTPLAN